MDVVFQNLECDNMQMSDSLRNLEAENSILTQQVNTLEKVLEKEKKFHRKFADEVIANEVVRLENFRKEKHKLVS